MKFLETLPKRELAFAYGSAVYPQIGYKPGDTPMVDLIITVDDSEEFHRENISMNRKVLQ